MFDIHFIVDDKNLVSVLRNLDKLAYNLEVRPVSGATIETNGKQKIVKPVNEGKGSMTKAALDYLKGNGILNPTPGDLRRAAVAAGMREESYTGIIQTLLAHGQMSRSRASGKGTTARYSYQLVKERV